MELQKETDWRQFFTDPELHQTICLATVLLLGKVLDHAVKSKFISKEEYHRKISELKSFSTNDIGTVDSLFFLNC